VTNQAIILITRERPEDLRRCLASVVTARLPGSPIIIVDQSRSDDTELIVRAVMAEHGGIDYIRSTRAGATTARNEGASRAVHDVLLFIDDDCEVDPGWARAWADVFDSNSAIGLGFGTVSAPPYDIADAVLPTFDPGRAARTFGPEVLRRGPIHLGLGANMAMRRSTWQRAGGFDEHLGPGSEFPAAEEGDMVVRVIDLDAKVALAPGPRVIHHGFREGTAAANLMRGYCLAGGAMYGKHIRSGDRRAIFWAAGEFWRLSSKAVWKTVTGVRPTGLNAARYFVKGLVRSTRVPIDKAHRMYTPRPVLARAS
jgi:GT2 family glycosyltransferase